MIPVDGIFSPVRRVAFSVEPTRVEQATNYDRLTLDIETDGSITPKEALASAGQTLRNLVGLLAELSSVPWGLELGAAGTSTGWSALERHRSPAPVGQGEADDSDRAEGGTGPPGLPGLR